ncbi:hypothetical protein BDB00DRAFT_847019 [Zychaea mexicana]|uniref:uncharacterized protein n=1 Tax=Zychaea mexicana TaxID=64656 RepID=UPI0022FDF39F|nr:uncharacterized protein BDB00DRAFT_847019 [Zychaea mexicana]KAI9488691.1 hypothetical protein BDB00DRAFT_847019 [Zychaea mexicana]
MTRSVFFSLGLRTANTLGARSPKNTTATTSSSHILYRYVLYLWYDIRGYYTCIQNRVFL